MTLVGGSITISGNGTSEFGAGGNFTGGIVLDGGALSANRFALLTVDGNVMMSGN